MNNVCLIGRLTKDPETRYTQTNNTIVVNFSLAVNRRFVRENEERQADFIPIIAWLKQENFVVNILRKANRLELLEGYKLEIGMMSKVRSIMQLK